MIVYKITNLVNSKLYIGQTTKTIQERLKKHIKDSIKEKRNSAINLAMRKYDTQNFIIEPLEYCSSLEELNSKEAHYIILLNSLSPNGYNLRHGGNFHPHSEESNKKNSLSHTGKKHSKKSRKKISESLKNRKEEDKTRFWKGKKLPDSVKQKMSISRMGKPGTTNRQVICLDTGILYPSITAAAKAMNVLVSHMYKTCGSYKKKINGMSFHYKDWYDK